MTRLVRAVYLVAITLPPGMDKDQGAHELKASVSFGGPEVVFTRYQFVREVSRDDDEPVG